MMPADVPQLHDRISKLDDKLSEKIDNLAQSVSVVVTKCGICGKTVMGKGNAPLGDRITRIEVATTDLVGVKAMQKHDHDLLTALEAQDKARPASSTCAMR